VVRGEVVVRDPPQPAAAAATALSVGERREISRRRIAERNERRQLAQVTARPEVKKEIGKRRREEDPGVPAQAVPASDNTCIICEHSHITTATVPCGCMMYCNHCIVTWLKKNNTCPHCRQQVTTSLQLITKFNATEEYKKQKHDDAAAAADAPPK
jgi:hypothetical protein